jgi:hypothetical protein
MQELLCSIAVTKPTKVNQVMDAAIECVEFQNSVLINWVECRKHKTLLSINSKIPLSIRTFTY